MWVILLMKVCKAGKLLVALLVVMNEAVLIFYSFKNFAKISIIVLTGAGNSFVDQSHTGARQGVYNDETHCGCGVNIANFFSNNWGF